MPCETPENQGAARSPLRYVLGGVRQNRVGAVQRAAFAAASWPSSPYLSRCPIPGP